MREFFAEPLVSGRGEACSSRFAERESFLIFARHFGFCLLLGRAKIFGHRSQNNSLGCFVHCVRLPFKTLRKITKGALTYAFFVILVDPRGVEPLSENLLIRPSPSAVRYLNFPSQAVNGQTSRLGSHFLRGRLNGERPTHVHR